jgi:hypothetical protein
MDGIERRLNQQGRTIEHARIVAYIALRRNAKANIYCAGYVGIDGKRWIARNSTLGYAIPHFLGRNVLNASRVGVRGGFGLVELCRGEQTKKKNAQWKDYGGPEVAHMRCPLSSHL